MGMENIFSCADEMDFAPQANIDSGFFANDFELGDDIQFAGQPVGDDIPNMDSGISLASPALSKPERQISGNWQKYINRAFMSGMTAKDILDAVGEEIMSRPDSAEILGYLKKYEGFIGPVFIDISVLEEGFPISRIPKNFGPYRKFAINCTNRKKFESRSFTGKTSGDIDNFLNANEQMEVVSQDVCEKTGLPVFKKGMFTKAVVSELLSELGESDGDISRLQELLKERVLGIQKPKEVNQAVGDFKYGLKEASMDVELPEADLDSPKVQLKDPQLEMGEFQNPEVVSNFKMDYTGSAESDIEFVDEQEEPVDVKLDDQLRF